MRRTWLAAASVLLVVAVGGCAGLGGGGSSNSTSGTGATGAPPKRQGQPRGHLTPAEYRAIVTEYRRLRPLQQRDGGAPGELARGRRACQQLRSPDTVLVMRVRADCNNAIAFFIAFDRLTKAGTDCTTGSERDQIVCGRNRYSQMADAIRSTRNGGTALNTELQRRAIRGLCADSIGMTPAQVAAYREAEAAARDAVDAISIADAAGFSRAQDELASALDAGSGGDPLAGIERACRPAGAKPPHPRVAPQKPAPQPRRKPLPRVPDGGGVKA